MVCLEIWRRFGYHRIYFSLLACYHVDNASRQLKLDFSCICTSFYNRLDTCNFILIILFRIKKIQNLFSILNYFFKGFTFSALGFIFVKWAPADEKSSLVGFSIAGTYIGVVISMLFGSYLCEYGFLEGWGSIFILFGKQS